MPDDTNPDGEQRHLFAVDPYLVHDPHRPWYENAVTLFALVVFLLALFGRSFGPSGCQRAPDDY
jgi:hypothetical protein